MKKQSFSIALGVGLLSGLAFATPGHAGGMYVTTVTLTNNAGVGDVDDIVTYWKTSTGGVISLTDPILTATAGTIDLFGSDVVDAEFNLGLAAGGKVTFTFQSTDAKPMFVSGEWSYTGSNGRPAETNIMKAHDDLTVSTAPVPEPTSMALLAGGITGLLAFRRLWSRKGARSRKSESSPAHPVMVPREMEKPASIVRLK